MTEGPLGVMDGPLGALKAHLITLGYRVEVDADGTERLICPDGTVAMTAKPQAISENTPENGTMPPSGDSRG